MVTDTLPSDAIFNLTTLFVTSVKLKALLPTAILKSGLSSVSLNVNVGVASVMDISPLVTVPVVNIFCATKLGVILLPAIAALADMFALAIPVKDAPEPLNVDAVTTPAIETLSKFV